MTTTTKVYYTGTSNSLVQVTSFTDNSNNTSHEIYVKINLTDETIIQSGQDLPRPLGPEDVYVFRSVFEQFFQQIVKDSSLDKENVTSLVQTVLNMKYMETYLVTSVGLNDIPYNGCVNYLFLFSTLVIPYQIVDWEVFTKSDYKKIIYDTFSKTNSMNTYNLKMAMRYVLLIPGLILSPLILLTAVCALSKMN